jgi:tRNA(adenine34) deaminase
MKNDNLPENALSLNDQMSADQDYKFMQAALRQAQVAYDAAEVPIGCVIVKEGKIVGRGYNQVESLQDATAHAEILAIGAASNTLENWRLQGCTLYVTLEPCPMCAGAILNSRIERIVYGCKDKRLGACGTTIDFLPNNPIHRSVAIQGGILQEECLGIIQAFFIELRAKKK